MKLAPALTVTAILALAGCSAPAAPLEVTTAPPATTSSPSPSASETPAAEGERGTRANPLAVGETRKLSGPSIWTVGASAATTTADGYVVLPLSINIDWAAAQTQADEAGQGDVADLGLDPWQALYVKFVTADGRSYETFDQYDAGVTNQLIDVGTVYPPADAMQVNVAVSVPAGEVAGGVWRVENSRREGVFIALQ